MMKSRELWFQILDYKGNVLIGRVVKFPHDIDAELIDKEIAEILIRESERKNDKFTRN